MADEINPPTIVLEDTTTTPNTDDNNNNDSNNNNNNNDNHDNNDNNNNNHDHSSESENTNNEHNNNNNNNSHNSHDNNNNNNNNGNSNNNNSNNSLDLPHSKLNSKHITPPSISSLHPLHSAALRADRTTLSNLLSKYPSLVDKPSEDNFGYTPLHCACISGDSNCVKQLLRVGSSVNTKDSYGYTPLHMLCASLPRDENLQTEKELKSKQQTEETTTTTSTQNLGSDQNSQQQQQQQQQHTPQGLESNNNNNNNNNSNSSSNININYNNNNNNNNNDSNTQTNTEIQPDSLSQNTTQTQSTTQTSIPSEKHPSHTQLSFPLPAYYQNATRSPLHSFIKCARMLIKKGAKVSNRDDTRRTPLHYAALNKCASMVSLLMEFGAHVKRDRDGNTPLHISALTRDHLCLKALVYNYESVNNLKSRRTSRTVSLPHMFPSGTQSEAKALQKRSSESLNISPNTTSGEETPPIMNSTTTTTTTTKTTNLGSVSTPSIRVPLSITHNVSLSHIQLEKTASKKTDEPPNIDFKDLNGHTPLQLVILSHLPPPPSPLHAAGEINYELLSNQIDLNQEETAECVRVLVQAGAQVNIPDHSLNTVLHMACFLGLSKCVEALLTPAKDAKAGVWGISLSATNSKGETAIHAAASSPNHAGATKCLKKLLKFQPENNPSSSSSSFTTTTQTIVDVNAVDLNGCTPLHHAVKSVNFKFLSLLFQHHANVNIKDKNGKTPLHFALEKSNSSLCSMLVSGGADVTLMYKYGKVHDMGDELSPTKNNNNNNNSEEPIENYELTDRYGFSPDVPSNTQKWIKVNDYYTGIYKSRLKLEIGRQMKWAKMISIWSSFPDKKVKERVHKGIPDSVRGVAWQLLCSSNSVKAKSEHKYQDLLERHSEHVKQIDLDINRTDRNHSLFRQRYGQGQQSLFNILKAYSVLDPEVGYCQGMSSVTALLLMYMEEEEAFWVLNSLMEDGPKYSLRVLFKPGFPKLYQNYQVFESILTEFLPDLDAHFKKQGLETSMYATKWFLTLFLGVLPFPVLVRVWDLIFSEGYVVLHIVAVGLLKMYRKDLLAYNFEQLLGFFLSTEWLTLDPDQFFKLVFSRSIPRKRIRNFEV